MLRYSICTRRIVYAPSRSAEKGKLIRLRHARKRAVLFEQFEFVFKRFYASLNVTSVAFKFRFTGASRTDTAAETRHFGTVSRKAR